MSELKQRSPASSYDVLNLGCGDDQPPTSWNVDAVASVGPDEIHDLNDVPWPWPDESFERIRASHVLEHLDDAEAALGECERVLEPGGRLVTHWPMGADARADPDHVREWTWRTPEFYTGVRHWDVDVGLVVVERRCRIWSMHPGWLSILHNRWLRWRQRRHGDGIWCFTEPHVSGEFTVVFEKP